MTRYEFTPRGMVPRKDGRWVHASDVEKQKNDAMKESNNKEDSDA